MLIVLDLKCGTFPREKSQRSSSEHGASDLGLVPAQDSSGEHRRLGHISKQPFMERLYIEGLW